MKRKIAAYIALVVTLVLVFSGCGSESAPGATATPEAPIETPLETPAAGAVDYNLIYSDVLKQYYKLIVNADFVDDVDEKEMGVVEAAQYLGDEALDTIGYLISDINGDGVSELLIGVSNEEYGYALNDLYGVYTVKDSNPVFVLAGRSRNNYSLLKGGSFYNGGSNGASHRIFGEYKLDENAELKCVDFYFSYEKDNNPENIGYYHNTTGVYEKSASEELKISLEEFEAKESALAGKSAKLKFNPFSKLDLTAPGLSTPAPEASAGPEIDEVYGSWKCYDATPDGSEFVLFVDILADGTASYRCGPPYSELMVDCSGTWTTDSTGEIIILDLYDRIEGFSFKGEWYWSRDNANLALKHKSGTPFLYGGEGKTFNFTAQ